MQPYDVIVIGSGAAGSTAALHAARNGLRVAVIESDTPGGVTVNLGADFSKALLTCARNFRIMKNECDQLGISLPRPGNAYAQSLRRSRMAAAELSRITLQTLLSQGVEVYFGRARLASPSSVQVDTPGSPPAIVHAAHIIIATGSNPYHLPEFSFDNQQIVTYREAVLQDTLPSKILIVGGGALGLEFATLWNAFRSEIFIIEKEDGIAPHEDAEIRKEISAAFISRGIHLHTSSTLQSLLKSSASIQAVINTPTGSINHKVDMVLEAVSFKHNSEGLGLESQGVQTGARGVILVNENMATNVPGIWAVGDVNGKFMLAAAARAMAIHCVEKILGNNPPPLDFEWIPRITYSQPQIASIGLTEAQIRERNLSYKKALLPMNNCPRAWTLLDPDGMVKLLWEKGSGQILGAHFVGADVENLLAEIALAHAHGLSIQDLERQVRAHPTMNEVISLALDSGHQL